MELKKLLSLKSDQHHIVESLSSNNRLNLLKQLSYYRTVVIDSIEVEFKSSAIIYRGKDFYLRLNIDGEFKYFQLDNNLFVQMKELKSK